MPNEFRNSPQHAKSRLHPDPVIHVCPLAHVADTVERTGARHLVSLLARADRPPTPSAIALGRHLRIAIDDITEPCEGLVMAEAHHIRLLIDFARDWDRAAPMVIHCHAGISRSTAAAFVVMCVLHPQSPPEQIARSLLRAAPWATPNERIVTLADDLLGRGGSMLLAIATAGMGDLGEEPRPFRLLGPFQ